MMFNHHKGEMMKAGRLFLLAVLALLFVGSTLAGDRTPVVTKRQHNQQARIRQGVKSGELTRAETRRLERGEAKIQRDKMKAKADGVVTPRERAKLNREENRESRRIYRAKHNNRVRKG